MISIATAMIVAIILFLCAVFLREKSQTPVPLDELERSEIEIDNMDAIVPDIQVLRLI